MTNLEFGCERVDHKNALGHIIWNILKQNENVPETSQALESDWIVPYIMVCLTVTVSFLSQSDHMSRDLNSAVWRQHYGFRERFENSVTIGNNLKLA